MVEVSPAGARTLRVRNERLSQQYRMQQGQWTPVTDAGDLEYLLNSLGVVLAERPELGLRYYRCLRATNVEIPGGSRRGRKFRAGELVVADGVTHRTLKRHTAFDPVPAVEVMEQLPKLRVLVVRAGGLGDVLLTTPVLDTLRRRFPEARLCYATAPHNVRLLEHNEALTAIYTTLGAYDDAPFGVVVDLGYWAETAPGRESIHRTDIFARAFGLEGVDDYAMTYHVTEEERAEAVRLIGDGPPLIGVQLAGSINRRTPPIEWYGPLLDRLKSKGYRLALFGEYPVARSDDTINLTGKPSLALVASVIEQCAGVVAGDSGLLHLANALRRPCVGIFGPVDPDLRVRDMPWCRTVTGNQAAGCAPCNDHQTHQCEGYPRCLTLVDHDEVLAALEEVVDGNHLCT